jgi:hypothetical protein
MGRGKGVTVDEDDDISFAHRKRSFLLNLSVQDGRSFTEFAGMQPTSPDVALKEMEDVMRYWATLRIAGVTDSIEESAQWFADTMQAANGMGDTDTVVAYALVASFAMSAVIKLLDEKLVSLTHPVDVKVLYLGDQK